MQAAVRDHRLLQRVVFCGVVPRLVVTELHAQLRLVEDGVGMASPTHMALAGGDFEAVHHPHRALAKRVRIRSIPRKEGHVVHVRTSHLRQEAL